MTLTKIASTGVEDSLRWVLGANGTSDYTFTGPGLTGTVNDPTIYLTRGHTYIFQNNSGGHPFYIKTSTANGGTNDAYNTGVTNNGGGNGTEIVFTVPHDSPDILYYQCSSHASMAGQFNIAGSVADGSVTTAKIADDAVTTAKIANSAVNVNKIADNAVTTAKIINNAVNVNKIVDNAVTTAKILDSNVTTGKIADQAVTLAKLPHGTSSNDGKFLRANNGADPTFETITGTTINNNADNRVITGSGTANTLEGESTLTYSSPQLKLLSSDAAPQIRINSDTSDGTSTRFTLGRATANNHFVNGASPGDSAITVGGNLLFGVQTAEKMRLTSTGRVGIGDTNPQSKLAVSDAGSTADPVIMAHVADSNGGILGFGLYSTINSKYTFKVTNNGRIHVNDGIDFNMTSNTSGMTSELLDDYEEGTCTPNFQPASGSYGILYQSGHYTRIGDVVHLTASISVNGETNASGEVQITGLPFSVRSVNSTWSGEGGHGVGRWFYAGPNHYNFLVCDNSTDRIRVHKADGTFLNHTNMSTGYNTSQFSFTVTYLTDS